MRLKVALNFGLPIAIVGLALWAAPAIVGRTRSAKAAEEPPQTSLVTVRAAPGVGVDTRILPNQAPEDVVGAFMRSSVGSEAAFVSMDAIVHGRQVGVSQTVHLLEKSPNISYVWVLRVYREPTDPLGGAVARASRTLLDERFYTHQLFHVPADVIEMKPTFTESLELAPGTYLIQVGLNRIPANTDPRTLDREGLRKLKNAVSGGNLVVVSD
jgi:hypothetical protein